MMRILKRKSLTGTGRKKAFLWESRIGYLGKKDYDENYGL